MFLRIANADFSIDLIDASKFLAAKDAYKISMTNNWAIREFIQSSKELAGLVDVNKTISEYETTGEAGVSVMHNVAAPDSLAEQSAFTILLVLPVLVIAIAISFSVNNDADTACLIASV